MTSSDVVAFIYGSADASASEQDQKTWRDSKARNVRNWIAEKRLRGIRIAHGDYDVHEGDLERLRTLHHSDRSRSDPDAE